MSNILFWESGFNMNNSIAFDKNVFSTIHDFVDYLIEENLLEEFYKDFKSGYIHKKFELNNENEYLYERCISDYGAFLTLFSSGKSIFVFERRKIKVYDDFFSFLQNSLFTMNFRGKYIKELYNNGFLSYYANDSEFDELTRENFDKNLLLEYLVMFFLPQNGICIPSDNRWGFKLFDLNKVLDYQADRMQLENSLIFYKDTHRDKPDFVIYISFMEFILENFAEKDKLNNYKEFFIGFIKNFKYKKYHIPKLFLEKMQDDKENQELYINILVDKYLSKSLNPLFFKEALKDKNDFYNLRFENFDMDMEFDDEDYLISLSYAIENFDSLSDSFFKSINNDIFYKIITIDNGDNLHYLTHNFFEKLSSSKKHSLLRLKYKNTNKAIFFYTYLGIKKKESFFRLIQYFDSFKNDKRCFKLLSSIEKNLLSNKSQALFSLIGLFKVFENDTLNGVELALLTTISKKTMGEVLFSNRNRHVIINQIDRHFTSKNILASEETDSLNNIFPKLSQLDGDIVFTPISLLEEVTYESETQSKKKEKKKAGFVQGILSKINEQKDIDPYYLDVLNAVNKANNIPAVNNNKNNEIANDIENISNYWKNDHNDKPEISSDSISTLNEIYEIQKDIRAESDFSEYNEDFNEDDSSSFNEFNELENSEDKGDQSYKKVTAKKKGFVQGILSKIQEQKDVDPSYFNALSAANKSSNVPVKNSASEDTPEVREPEAVNIPDDNLDVSHDADYQQNFIDNKLNSDDTINKDNSEEKTNEIEETNEIIKAIEISKTNEIIETNEIDDTFEEDESTMFFEENSGEESILANEELEVENSEKDIIQDYLSNIDLADSEPKTAEDSSEKINFETTSFDEEEKIEETFAEDEINEIEDEIIINKESIDPNDLINLDSDIESDESNIDYDLAASDSTIVCEASTEDLPEELPEETLKDDKDDLLMHLDILDNKLGLNNKEKKKSDSFDFKSFLNELDHQINEKLNERPLSSITNFHDDIPSSPTDTVKGEVINSKTLETNETNDLDNDKKIIQFIKK